MGESDRSGIAPLNFDIDSYALIMLNDGDDNLNLHI